MARSGFQTSMDQIYVRRTRQRKLNEAGVLETRGTSVVAPAVGKATATVSLAVSHLLGPLIVSKNCSDVSNLAHLGTSIAPKGQ